MNKSTPLLVVLMASLLAAAVVFVGASASRADKGGCPNSHSENGASHSSENSAQGAAKQGERGCNDRVATPTPASEPTATPTAEPTAEPTAAPTATATPEPTPSATATAEPTATATATPEPTPTPTQAPRTAAPTATPPPGSDVEVVEVAVSSPADAIAGVSFMMSADASVRNNGPVTPVVVDTTFVPVLPSGCTATTGAVTVQNTTLMGNLITTISRIWTVTCTIPGSKGFTVTGTALIDPLQPVSDPNPANNSGSGSSATIIS